MSSANQKSVKESIPIYFSNQMPNKVLIIGKTHLPSEKSKFKVTTKPTQMQGVKEFNLLNDSNKNLFYSGRENKQDSNYILMKCNSDGTEIRMYTANNWVNFFKCVKKTEKKEDEKIDKEKIIKEKKKERNNKAKNYFNFHLEVKTEEVKKRGRAKKAGLLDRNKEEDLEIVNKKKKYLDDFKEDSHSSENDLDLKESDSEDIFKTEDNKKEKEKEKLKEKDEKKIKEDKNEEEEEEDEDDFDNDSSLNDIEKFESKYGNIDNLIGNKREREKTKKDEMEEELENLLRKKNRMTYDEIIDDLRKKFTNKEIETFTEDLLNEITSNFIGDNGEQYYFLKK